MTATRVSWRVAETTNSFDIDCLPWGMERVYGKAGAPAWSRIPRVTGERKSNSLQAHAGQRRSSLPHTPSGREPLLFGGKRLHATIPRASTGSLTISFPGRGTLWARARLIHKSSEADVIDQPQSQEILSLIHI